ncbi:aldo/keto reductase [Methanospirillum sp. J.3.6.1-F.2.7.3]|uniref:Aldo/keto reductase n=1 Tax=Methanospirillum purgamenti TaxID=2834276 RepID=A0A8E7B2G4_9EURY|nr:MULTISPECIES: aldo/keto reductase [Methanospirillum]MDX8549496.1 aldo/keto reductase [Methanospirillum hungatei]QVV89222.1 aldo/keto reductase [Methanospirillum sp. J.3.6.1-F.2.7.3]
MICSQSSNKNNLCIITLGTAQFGLNYGVTNKTGCPNDEELYNILNFAHKSGLDFLDTARAYGNAEERLGEIINTEELKDFRIVSKLLPFSEIRDEASDCELFSQIDDSVFSSCKHLRRSHIDVIMFHRFSDMISWDGKAVERLLFHVKKGTVGEIGVSVYSPDEAIISIKDKRIKNIQIPFNLLDHRWISQKFLQELKKRDDVKIFARSIFLQGLLINNENFWPKWFSGSKNTVNEIDNITRQLKRKNKLDLCISYVRAFPWITSLVIGVEKTEQLKEIISLTNEPPLNNQERKFVENAFHNIPVRLLNPSLW